MDLNGNWVGLPTLQPAPSLELNQHVPFRMPPQLQTAPISLPLLPSPLIPITNVVPIAMFRVVKRTRKSNTTNILPKNKSARMPRRYYRKLLPRIAGDSVGSSTQNPPFPSPVFRRFCENWVLPKNVTTAIFVRSVPNIQPSPSSLQPLEEPPNIPNNCLTFKHLSSPPRQESEVIYVDSSSDSSGSPLSIRNFDAVDVDSPPDSD